MLLNSATILNLSSFIIGLLPRCIVSNQQQMAAQTATFGKVPKIVKPSFSPTYQFLLPLAFLHLNLVLAHGKHFSFLFHVCRCKPILVVALLASGSSIWLTALTVIALDIRHVLYGPALYNLIPTKLNLKKTAVWAWGLTDEVFASGMIQLSQRRQQWSESWMLGLSLFSWMSWASGSLLGGLFADQVAHLPKFYKQL